MLSKSCVTCNVCETLTTRWGSFRDRIGHRRTIYNLEEEKQKKRMTGTLDVAFKKRFFSMTAEDETEGKRFNHLLEI